MTDKLIITGASPAYEPALLALLGSLNCNWPGHPRVLVYDLGMGAETLDILRAADIEVRKVPEFCPHWRTDFTWKPWCFRDAPAESYLWLDAGLCVLRPLDEAFAFIEKLGYFCVALYNHAVAPSVPEPLRASLGLDVALMNEMVSISSNIHGFRKVGPGATLIDEAYALALNRENMQATTPQHRHDQSLLTLLLHKHFGTPLLADYHIYAFHFPPDALSRQKVWVHRRKMLAADLAVFRQYVGTPGPPHIPAARVERREPSALMKLRIRIAKWRGRYPGDDREDRTVHIRHGNWDGKA